MQQYQTQGKTDRCKFWKSCHVCIYVSSKRVL